MRSPHLACKFIPWALLALLVVCAPATNAQCTSSSVLWVSELVNANVGLNAGGGRCTSATVAGAAYDDPAQPFGIQAAFDCACAGAEIRILAGAGNYSSTTASWNNRFDATKQVNVQSVGQSANRGAGLLVQGYVDVSTPCLTNAQTNCPVVMDFTGGTSGGIFFNGGGVIDGNFFWGLAVTGAQNSGIALNSSRGLIFASAGYDNGQQGVQASGNVTVADLHTYDNGTDGMLINGFAFILETHGNGTTGSGAGYINNAAGIGAGDRIISYENADDGLAVVSGASTVQLHYSSVNNGGSGFGGAIGNKFNSGLMSSVAVDNSNWAGVDYVTTSGYMSLFACLVSTNNGLGNYSPANTPREAGVNYTIENSAGVSYPAAPDFSPTAAICGVADNCGFTYYGSNTSAYIVPGAAPGCGGGITLQPVRNRN